MPRFFDSRMRCGEEPENCTSNEVQMIGGEAIRGREAARLVEHHVENN